MPRAGAPSEHSPLRFKNGVRVRLQELDEGQRVEVLAFSSEKAAQRRLMMVYGDSA
jgi:hypothetical protein